MPEIDSIAIVGAGQAGASAIETLRAHGYDGRLSLIGEEPLLPYQRPPLSKKYLLGEIGVENLLLKPETFYEQHGVEMRLNVRVDEIETADRRLRLSDSTSVGWDRLLIATGAEPRRLPTGLLNGFAPVFTVRSVEDVDRIAPRFVAGGRVLIVGGGYIGLEVAAIARQRNLETTLIEAAPRILQRVAAGQTSTLFADLHRTHGVDLREGVGLTSLEPQNDGSCVVALSDGTGVVVDFIVAGIGVDPRTELAAAAGLEIDNGIAVNERCETSTTGIFSAGDCASFPWHGRRVRLESVQNAIEQGRTAALNMIGESAPYDPVPWFWSDQYDVKLQIAGLNHGFDQTVIRPGVRDGAQSIWYFKSKRLLAVDAFNDAPAFMTAKQLLAAGASLEPDTVADPATNLRAVARDAMAGS